MVRTRSVCTVCLVAACMAVFANCAFAQLRDSFEKTPLLKEPKTPEEMFGVTLLMVDLARVDLAKQYLEQFLATNPDDEMLLKLRDKHGAADFLKLARVEALHPQSTELLDQLIAVVKRRTEDPEFVASLVQRLIQEPAKRDLTISEMRNLGISVVPEILRQMSSDEMRKYEEDFVDALKRMGKQVVPALIGAFDAPAEQVKVNVFEILGYFNATEAVPYLWYPAFAESQPSGVRDAAKACLGRLLKGSAKRADQMSSVVAANELNRLANLYYRKHGLLPQTEDGQVVLWTWDQERGTVVRQAYAPDVAELLVSARFSRQSLDLSPEQPDPQRQYLASVLGLEVARRGWEQPRVANPGSAMYLALTAGEPTVSRVLSEALEAGQAGTAVAALEVLSQIGNRDQLPMQSGLKSPIVASLNSPDPRVQFAAATTILKLMPKSNFRNANRVVGILARSTVDPAQSRVLVIDADQMRANQTAGFVNDGGFEGIVAATGREGFELAAASAGIDFVVIHVNCLRWELSQTLANFRADSRTAALPIVIYGPASLANELARRVTRTAPAVYVFESGNSSDFLDQVMPFIRSLKTPPLSAQERILQKHAAVYWLAAIASGEMTSIFDITQAEADLSTAVDDPTVAHNALVALGGISTRSAQRRLSEVAINKLNAPDVRVTAANQLAFHIQKHGRLLTQEEVAAVSNEWKIAKDPRVKSAFATVMGTLQPDASIVGERLRQFPVPPTTGH